MALAPAATTASLRLRRASGTVKIIPVGLGRTPHGGAARPLFPGHRPTCASAEGKHVKAIQLIQGDDKKTIARIESLDEKGLPAGDVTVRVEYSSLNFKDALAITGRGAIVKSWPLVPGIDLAGVVEESAVAEWRPGDRVVVNGWGMGESHGGGLALKARLPAAWLLRLPASLSTRQAMAVGTAGYTAALCAMALQRHGIAPDAGPILVTGASGGVGSVATALLAGLGYAVTASTGRPQEKRYLEDLGAVEVIDRAGASPRRAKPLQRSAGPAPSTRSAATRLPTSAPRPGSTAPSPPAAWRRAPLSGDVMPLHPARHHALRHQLRLRRQRDLTGPGS